MQENNFTRRKVATYTYLRAVSWTAFDLAKKSEEHRYNHLITSMLFAAFCLESFLNHVGKDKISFWKNLQRSLSPHEKLNVISTVLEFKPDFLKRPFQTFPVIFSLRNNLVHAETIEIENGFQLSESDNETTLETLAKWEDQITIRNAEIFSDDTKDIIMEIAKAAGYDTKTILEMRKVERKLRTLGFSSMSSSG